MKHRSLDAPRFEERELRLSMHVRSPAAAPHLSAVPKDDFVVADSFFA